MTRRADDTVVPELQRTEREEDPREKLEHISVGDYMRAVAAVWGELMPQQQSMLLGHASVPDRTLSMAGIARLGGYNEYGAANFHYGKLGRLIASRLGLDELGDYTNWTAALAVVAENRDDKGHFQWTLRRSLCEALVRLGHTERSSYTVGYVEAAREIEEDPATRKVSETTRLALINARIGQGDYRQRMLRLWDGRCALTGCAIERVLVASHAKPWLDSSNEERLDEYNGLLLAASIDRLFDAGLVAFSDEGELLADEQLGPADLTLLGIGKASRLRFVRSQHRPYLRAHRILHGFEEE